MILLSLYIFAHSMQNTPCIVAFLNFLKLYENLQFNNRFVVTTVITLIMRNNSIVQYRR